MFRLRFHFLYKLMSHLHKEFFLTVAFKNGLETLFFTVDV